MTVIGDCTLKRLKDGRISVVRADTVVDVSDELLLGELVPGCSFDGETLTINAVEGVVKYRKAERHITDWGHAYTRMEKVA